MYPPKAPRDLALVLVCVVTIYCALFALGANRNDIAVFVAAIFGIELAAAAVILRVTPNVDWRKIAIPAFMFCVAIGFCALALTPYTPDGPHPLWSYVQATPAATFDRSVVIIGLIKLGGVGCCFLFGFLIGSEDHRARLFNRLVMAAGGVYAAWALVANIISPTRVFGLFETMHAGRLTASLLSANTAGTLLGALFVMAVSDLLWRSRNTDARAVGFAWHLVLPTLNCAVLGMALLLTNSRGAFAATVFALVLTVLWTRLDRDWRQDRPQRAITNLAFIALIIVFVTGSGIVLGRYTTAVQDWMAQRDVIYSTHWQAVLAAPWMGYGLGTFDEINKLLANADNYDQLWNVRAAHNVFLQWLEEAGVLGTVPMCLSVFATLWLIVRGVSRRRSRKNKALLRGIVGASAVIIVHGWSDFGLQVPAIADLWALLLGCGAAVAATSHATLRVPNFDGAARLKPALPSIAGGITGVIVFAFGGCGFASLTGVFGDGPVILPIAAGYALQADRLLTGSEGSKPAAIARAAALTGKELSLDPASATGWLRLAYIRSLEPSVDERGISDLIEKSFAVAPLDPDVLEWRTRFCLDRWDRVSPSVRRDVLDQARISWKIWPQKMKLQNMPASIGNPAGRLALTMAIRGFQVEEAAARAGVKSAN
jgi:Lipid A core - O-antigen ligase and related enzymes